MKSERVSGEVAYAACGVCARCVGRVDCAARCWCSTFRGPMARTQSTVRVHSPAHASEKTQPLIWHLRWRQRACGGEVPQRVCVHARGAIHGALEVTLGSNYTAETASRSVW